MSAWWYLLTLLPLAIAAVLHGKTRTVRIRFHMAEGLAAAIIVAAAISLLSLLINHI